MPFEELAITSSFADIERLAQWQIFGTTTRARSKHSYCRSRYKCSMNAVVTFAFEHVQQVLKSQINKFTTKQ